MREITKKINAIIPARAGSKGIPGKNIRPFNNKPLIFHASKAAIESKCFDKIILSTDSEEIALFGKEIGLEVPFLRDESIAKDESKSIDVVFDVIKRQNLEGSICLFQATSPLVNKDDFINACDLHLKNNKSVLSVSEYLFNPSIVCNQQKDLTLRFMKKNQGIPRQQLKKIYKLNGALFINEISYLFSSKTLAPDGALPYFMPKYRSIDIDDELDWKMAEFIQREIDSFE